MVETRQRLRLAKCRLSGGGCTTSHWCDWTANVQTASAPISAPVRTQFQPLTVKAEARDILL